MTGKQLYEAWNRLHVEHGGAGRPYSQMCSEDPREAYIWDELAAVQNIGVLGTAELNQLRAALEQGEVEEAGTDYLVILRENRHGYGDTAFGSSSLTEARARADACRAGYGIVRIQKRQKFTGPWIDLEDQEG